MIKLNLKNENIEIELNSIEELKDFLFNDDCHCGCEYCGVSKEETPTEDTRSDADKEREQLIDNLKNDDDLDDDFKEFAIGILTRA